MHWHIDTDIVSLIVISAIYIYCITLFRSMPDKGPIARNRQFLRCLHAGVTITVVDIIASIVMEVPVSRFTYHFFMTAYFVTVELVIVEWFIYVTTILYRPDERGYRLVPRIVLGTYAAYAVFNITNPWTGFVYSLGPNNEYQRGPFFALMIMLYALYTAALLIIILARWKHIPKEYPRGILLLTPIIIAVAITVQLMVPGLLLIMSAYMICLLLAFLFLQLNRTRSDLTMMQSLSKAAVTDKLTGLLNRTGMELTVNQTWEERAGEACTVIIADIDDLKGINDALGHTEGDRAIAGAAEKLRAHFEPNGAVVRYGGDEFLVLLTDKCDQLTVANSLKQLISEIASIRIGANDDVPVRCSMGASSGIVGADAFETLCSQADTALYHVKRSGKNNCSFYTPDMEQSAG